MWSWVGLVGLRESLDSLSEIGVILISAGRSASQVADELVPSIQTELPGFEIKRSAITFAGEEGVVLDNMPGQDISRQIIALHNEHLYKLTFVPASEDADEAYTKMESLYKTVTDSFHFLNHAPEATTTGSNEKSVLIWEGKYETSDEEQALTSLCAHLEIKQNGQAVIAQCDGSEQLEKSLGANNALDLS